jgi:hypothetical protein
MSAKFLTPFILALGLTSSGALAAERGSSGLVEMPLIARNAAKSEISCSVALAHWYSAELGRAAPGAKISVSFWHDPKTGALYLLNDVGDRMAVQMTWCGFAGRSWETRSVLNVAEGKARDLTCVSGTDRLACR